MRIAAFICVLLIVSPRAFAQSSAAPDSTARSSTLDSRLLRDLPGSDNLFALLETTQPILTSDKFFGGGLYIGQPGRVGGFLGSWSQTLFRLGDVNLTDPTSGGVPLLFPDLMLWEKVDVMTGLMTPDVNAAGLAIGLEPRTPSTAWTRTIQLTTAHFGHRSSSEAPALIRSDGSDRVAFMASGPVMPNRVGLLVAGSWATGKQLERSEAAPVSADIGSAFAELSFTPRHQHDVNVIGWVQRTRTPFEQRIAFGEEDRQTTDTAGHAQASWSYRGATAWPWRAFAAYTARDRSPDQRTSTIPVLERLRDGPMERLASIADNTVYQWSLGGRVSPRRGDVFGATHHIDIGLDAFGARAEASSFFNGLAAETVDAVPARVWRFSASGGESVRHEIGFAGFLRDRIDFGSRVQIDAALRYDAVSASAEGGANDIQWRTPLPRASFRWILADAWRPTLIAGFAQSAYRLPLDLLAIGDPAAPIADVFRWDASRGTTPIALGPLVTRTGPGLGADSSFSTIDDRLKRPHTDEVVVGVEVRPWDSFRMAVTGVARRERDMVGLVNTGTPAYTVTGVLDPGADLGSVEDDRFVPVFNRTPDSFGRDRYQLTNPQLREATFNGVEVDFAYTKERVMLSLGATAGRAIADAANRGIGPFENDQSLIGELASDPNSATFARGRPFNDRAYTAKLVGIFDMPMGITVGAVARYQDGQPFARMLVFPSLNQGAEAVRAFANGDSRFTYIGTLDVRLQKRFSTRGRNFAVVLDAYNLTNLANSVEEHVTELPDVRLTTAVQPPLTIQVGLRATF